MVEWQQLQLAAGLGLVPAACRSCCTFRKAVVDVVIEEVAQVHNGGRKQPCRVCVVVVSCCAYV